MACSIFLGFVPPWPSSWPIAYEGKSCIDCRTSRMPWWCIACHSDSMLSQGGLGRVWFFWWRGLLSVTVMAISGISCFVWVHHGICSCTTEELCAQWRNRCDVAWGGRPFSGHTDPGSWSSSLCVSYTCWGLRINKLRCLLMQTYIFAWLSMIIGGVCHP